MNGVAADTANYPKGLPTLAFSFPENRFSGDAGCNRMMGNFTHWGPGELRFTPAAPSMLFCPNISKMYGLLKALKGIDS